MNSIKICYWNANGLSQHKHEVEVFLKSHNIQILLVSETHFTIKNCFRIRGYTTYDTKHPNGKACGGSAIIIQNKVNHIPLKEFETEYLQSTSIYLSDMHLTICSVYSPPRHNIKKEEYVKFFQTLGNKFIAAGDYNAKHTHWGSRLISPKGRQLLEAISISKLDVISSGSPTYWPTDLKKTPDLIDFAVIKGIQRHEINVENSYDLSSDHSPVILSLFNPCSNLLQNVFPNKRTNWLKYKKYISSHLSLNVSLKNVNEIDDAITILNDTLLNAVKVSTPVNFPTARQNFKYPRSIIELINEKRDLRRQWQRYRSPHLKRQFNQAQRILHKAIKKHKEKSLQDFLCNLDATPKSEYSLWKAVNSKRPIKSQVPIRLINGSWAKTYKEIANTFAEHLEKVFTPNPSENNTLLQHTEDNFQTETHCIRISTLQAHLNDLNVKKSPGPDKVTARMLKELPLIAQYFILYIYNSMLRLGYFPDSWKYSEIIMIPKPGKDPTQVTSYRPISLLPMLSKLFEKTLLHYLNPIASREQIIPNHQFGFRKNHSTIEQVHRIVTLVRKAFEQKQYCTSLFIDISQAFDKVWHEGLIHKIKQLLPRCTHKILSSYLSNRTFAVRLNSIISDTKVVSAGVPQGSILGPFLYTIYTADMPTYIHTHTATFADDTALISIHKSPTTASQQLQSHIEVLEKWLDHWKIRVNPSKCVHVTFTLNKSKCPNIHINGLLVPEKDHIKYLGIHLDKRLTWTHHIEAKLIQIKLKMAQLNWLLNKYSYLSLENKVLIYKSMIKPIWTYGIQLWGTACSSNVEKLQRRQSVILRQIVHAPWYVRNSNLHKDLNIPTIRNEIINHCTKYADKLKVHTNPLALTLLRFSGHQRLKRKDTLGLTAQ